MPEKSLPIFIVYLYLKTSWTYGAYIILLHLNSFKGCESGYDPREITWSGSDPMKCTLNSYFSVLNDQNFNLKSENI